MKITKAGICAWFRASLASSLSNCIAITETDEMQYAAEAAHAPSDGYDFATAAGGWAGHEPSTRDGLICAAVLTTAPTGSQILSCETSQGMTAFTRALPQGPLYRHAEESEDTNPQGDKNCFNHNSQLAASMPPEQSGRP